MENRPVRRKHFFQGLNFYTLFWAFLIGSFLGVVFETLYRYINFNQHANPAGLIYGPFNLVYGLGALAMTVGEYRLRKNSAAVILLAGMMIGGIVEIACSFAQEKIFHSVSWNYSDQPYNFQGRTSLTLAVYWGILSLLWIKLLYPFAVKWIQKIPNIIAKPLTWALFVFILFNIFMSGCAVLRWSDRQHGKPAQTAMDTYFDENYPDKVMQDFYPNLMFIPD